MRKKEPQNWNKSFKLGDREAWLGHGDVHCSGHLPADDSVGVGQNFSASALANIHLQLPQASSSAVPPVP